MSLRIALYEILGQSKTSENGKKGKTHSLSLPKPHSSHFSSHPLGSIFPKSGTRAEVEDFEYCGREELRVKKDRQGKGHTCSFAGKLNNKSATMRDLDVSCRKATSLFEKPGK